MALRPSTSTPSIRIPVPERSRRSQAERTAETRARIMQAVVACIDELGFPRTTTSEIARRAGVTWGAVQHHFGDKDGILAAVLEDSFRRFAARVGDAADETGSLEKRVALFVDRAWEHFASPHYRSTFEILLAHVPEDAETEPVWQAEMFRAWNGVWDRLFGDVGLSRRRLAVVQHYTLALLSGLAALRVLEGTGARPREAELSLLKQTLVRELGRGDSA